MKTNKRQSGYPYSLSDIMTSRSQSNAITLAPFTDVDWLAKSSTRNYSDFQRFQRDWESLHHSSFCQSFGILDVWINPDTWKAEVHFSTDLIFDIIPSEMHQWAKKQNLHYGNMYAQSNKFLAADPSNAVIRRYILDKKRRICIILRFPWHFADREEAQTYLEEYYFHTCY